MIPDLCQLSDVKGWLTLSQSQTSEDTLLSRLITAVSYDFGRETQRPDFAPAQDYVEVREGDGGDRIVLRHWPVNSVASITIQGSPVVEIPESTDDVSPGYWIDTDLDPERRWEVYLDGGVYVFTDLAQISIHYNAGYDNSPSGSGLPQDVQQACIEWTAHRYKSRQWIGQTQKHIYYGQSQEGETLSLTDLEIPPSVRRVIERYRRFDPLQTPPERVPTVAPAKPSRGSQR
jgi:hypothetical protein